MPTSIELVRFDLYSTATVELGSRDEILGVDTKIYNKERQPYLIVKRVQAPGRQIKAVSIWTVSSHKLSETEPAKELLLSDKAKLFTIQRISDSGARTGNYDSYLAWLIAVDCSGLRKPCQVIVEKNGKKPFQSDRYVGTFGKIDELYNVFAARQS